MSNLLQKEFEQKKEQQQQQQHKPTYLVYNLHNEK